MDNSTARMNFLVILTDDQGPWATSEYTPELVTPTLDALSQQATTFDNFYCASPVCSPARASLLTGRMPSAHGVHDWLQGERHPAAREDVYLGGLENLPETLHHAGYTCGMSGKWHVGTSRFPAPGFDFWYAHRLGGGPYYGAPVWDADGNKTEEPRYFTNAVADEACGFLDALPPEGEGAAPFYLQVNFTAPHDPWINNHPPELYDLYADCDFPSIPREDPHPWVAPRKRDFADAFADPTPYLQGYMAAISGVDRAVKQLLEHLDRTGRRDNTAIVYMADNGFSCGHHGIWGKGNGTYPMNFWENSVRVPFIVALPGQTEARRVADHVSATSFFATICELAGITPPEDPLRAGASITGLVDGTRPGDGTDSVVVYDEYGGGRMIRVAEWKFVDRYDGPRELYNLENDPDERENLAGSGDYAALEQEMADRLHEWFAAHETALDSAWDRDVRGFGQIQPPRKGLPDDQTYVRSDRPTGP
ncbi:MAG: sulfatase-like hydrolase/transferase [Actinomycetaceae bacterium]|nr:sulfatase-like hydrolase/transferase [Actinomycetaceae bacterium]MDU0970571.1 sulfatase-like hydrolase/transferase [Actinomycetaceae bacterium]